MRALLIATLIVLSGCHSTNPYQAQSEPLPPAPATAATFVDTSAYPSAPLNYGQYRDWGWFADIAPQAAQWEGSESFAQMISARLDQAGLRPAGLSPADLWVRAEVSVQTRLEQRYDSVGAYYGQRSWNHPFGLGVQTPIGRTIERKMLQVEIELIDANNQRIVWNGSGIAAINPDHSAQTQTLRQAVDLALDGYPPN